jgi:hypothetical protein
MLSAALDIGHTSAVTITIIASPTGMNGRFIAMHISPLIWPSLPNGEVT